MTIELTTTLDHFIVNNNGVNHKFESMSDAVLFMDNEIIKSESPRDVPSMQILRNPTVSYLESVIERMVKFNVSRETAASICNFRV